MIQILSFQRKVISQIYFDFFIPFFLKFSTTLIMIIIRSPGLLLQDFEAPGSQRKSEIQEQHFTYGS